MARVLKGLRSGGDLGTMHITSREDPKASPSAIEAFLDQNGFNIHTVSAFGSFQFFQEDTDLIVAGLRNLADFIDRGVAR